jgi:hypothetical protein
MRQVMPHRNNIVVECRSCKSFLRPIGSRPLNFGGCGNPAPPDQLALASLKLIITMIYNDLAKLTGRQATTCRDSRYAQ